MMRGLRIIIAIVATLAALGAMFAVQSVINSRPVVAVQAPPPPPPPAPPEIPKVHVLVAAREIRLGEVLKPQDMRWQPWPQDAQSEFFITRERHPQAIEKMESVMARVGFVMGEPIVEGKLVRLNGKGVMSAMLRKGMRAISVRISAESGAGGFILPGDYVDVLSTRQVEVTDTPRPGRPDRTRMVHRTDTLMTSVRVLAIDQIFNNVNGAPAAVGRTATLELLPEQTELIALAEQRGPLTLALRGLSELIDEKGNAIEQPMPVVRMDIRRDFMNPDPPASAPEQPAATVQGDEPAGTIQVIRHGVEARQQVRTQ